LENQEADRFNHLLYIQDMLRAKDVPDAYISLMAGVWSEVCSAIISEAWIAPNYQALFVADRLEHYARQLRAAVGADLLWPKEETEI